MMSLLTCQELKLRRHSGGKESIANYDWSSIELEDVFSTPINSTNSDRIKKYESFQEFRTLN
jgi:hypothetical protein